MSDYRAMGVASGRARLVKSVIRRIDALQVSQAQARAIAEAAQRLLKRSTNHAWEPGCSCGWKGSREDWPSHFQDLPLRGSLH